MSDPQRKLWIDFLMRSEGGLPDFIAYLDNKRERLRDKLEETDEGLEAAAIRGRLAMLKELRTEAVAQETENGRRAEYDRRSQ